MCEDYPNYSVMARGCKCFSGAWSAGVLLSARQPNTANNCFFTQPYCFNRDNLTTINSFLDILFANYAKVLPIRVDLEIMQDYVSAYGYEELKLLFTRLRNNLRYNRRFEHYVSYLAKLEFTPLSSWHYHAYFFFDGQYVCDDYGYAAFICDYWRHTITQGRGRAYSSNLDNRIWDAERYELEGMLHGNTLEQPIHPNRNALGKVIDYRDAEMIWKLRQSAYYLAKEQPDHLTAKQHYAKRLRCLTTGQIPIKDGRGRKRKV